MALFVRMFCNPKRFFKIFYGLCLFSVALCFLPGCPTSIPAKAGAKSRAPQKRGQNSAAQNSAAQNPAGLKDAQGWVPDLVGIASFTSLKTFFSAMTPMLQALDGKDRPLLGLAEKWKNDFGVDVTRPALLSLAGIDLQKPSYVLWRKANANAPVEHLFSLPVKSTSRVLGIFTQLLAESKHLRQVDEQGIVHFTSAKGTGALVSVPSADRLLIWLAPKDAQAAAALMGKALQTSFAQPFLDAFLKDQQDSKQDPNGAEKTVAYFSFAQIATDVLPWTSPLSLEKSARIFGQWTLSGNAQKLQVDHFFAQQHTQWRTRFAPQKLPLSHCALEKDALLALRLPAGVSAQWMPQNEFSATQERLSGMLSLYLYGRKALNPKAGLLDLSRFVLAGKPKDQAAAQELKLSVQKDAAVQNVQYGVFESSKVQKTQALRALEMVADERVFAMAFGQEHLLDSAFASADVSCNERSPGLMLRGTAARKQRWHNYDSPLARLMGQIINGVDSAELKTQVRAQSLRLQATVIFVP